MADNPNLTTPITAPPGVPAAPDPNLTAGPVLQTLAGQPPGQTTPTITAFGRHKEVAIPLTAEISSQPAEVEPTPEISPEMDKFVEKVEQQVVKPATETVIAQTQPAAVPKTISQPVVILPATEKVIQKGLHQSITHSVRWLAEWCLRQIRKFKNVLVVYRENS